MSNYAVAIDLGSSNTGIYQENEGVVLYEPSLVAFSSDNRKHIKEVGIEAKKLVGRTTDSTMVVSPVFEGDIKDEEACAKMLDEFLNKITVNRFSARPRVVASVPCGSDADTIRRYEKALRNADVSEYSFIESPILTAIGLGIPVTESTPAFIVDIGGGTTEIAAVSLDGIICGISVNMGGMSIDAMIISFMEEHFGIKIGALTAEKAKLEIGSLLESDQSQTIIRGRSVSTGRPFAVQITSQDLYQPLTMFFDKIFQIMGMVLAKLPAEVSADIRRSGIYFAGGVSKTIGLEEYFKTKMGIRANVHRDSEASIMLGGGAILKDKKLIERLKINKT